MQIISKDGKAIPHLGGTGKNPGGILLMSITTTMDPAGLIWCSTVQNSVTVNSSLLSPTGGVKHYISKCRKMATEILHENHGYCIKL